MAGRTPPAKPWERNRTTGSSLAGAAAESLPKPWERPQGSSETVLPSSSAVSASSIAAITPASNTGSMLRPWESTSSAIAPSTSYGSYSNSSYGGFGGSGYGSMYSSPMYRSYGGYGNGGYGNSMYGGGYGSNSMYGSGYGGGMYGSSFGSPYGGSMYGGNRPMGMQGPFAPNEHMGPPQPPTAWQAMLNSVQGVMHFFGRLSFLVDENAHAVHFFVTALLQLLDRFGSLYGELARFVLRLLGFKPSKVTKSKQQTSPGDDRAVKGVKSAPCEQQSRTTSNMNGIHVDNWNGLWSS